MTNNEIGNRIKSARKEKDLTLEDIASEIGVARSTVQRYEAGKIDKIKLPVISAIADAIGVNDAWLVGKSDKKVLTDAERFAKTAEIFNESHPNLSAVRVPIVRRVAAGIPLDSIEEIIGWEEMAEHKVKGDLYFGLKIQGHSMEPGIMDGDIVLCREQPDAEDGQIVVAIVNGNDGVCKRLKKYDDGSIALMSDNPAYPPIYLKSSEIEEKPVTIRGIVKELRRTF